MPLAFLTVAPIYGIGFVMAGLALVFKRIQAFFQILQFVFVFFLFIPPETSWAKTLPLSLGTRLIGKAMTEGQSLWNPRPRTYSSFGEWPRSIWA